MKSRIQATCACIDGFLRRLREGVGRPTAAKEAAHTAGTQMATGSKDSFSATERLINGLLADIKPKLATLDASSPEYG